MYVKIYYLAVTYQERGLEQNKKFFNSLELLTSEGSIIILHMCWKMRMEF